MPATVVVEMTGDEAKLWRAQQKVLAQQAKIANEYKKVAKEAKDAKKAAEQHAKAAEESFGSKASSALLGYAGGFLSVASAIGVVNQALNEMDRLGQEAAQRALDAAGKIGNLAQLASTPAEQKALREKAKQLVRMGGAANQGEAAGIIGGIEAAGAMGSFDLLARAKAYDVIDDPAKVAEAAQTIRTTMGAAEAGSIEQVFSKGVAAAAVAPGGVPDVMLAASKGGAMASMLGMTDEELFAATAIAAKGAGSAEQGGTQMASLLKGLAESGKYQEGTFREKLDKAIAENQDFGSMQDLLGRTEAISGLNSLKKMLGEYDKLLAETDQANTKNLVEERIELNKQDPDLRAAFAARRAAGNLQIKEDEQLGEQTQIANALRSEQKARALENAGELGELAVGALGYAEQKLVGARAFARGTDATDQELEASRRALIASNESLAESIRRLGGAGVMGGAALLFKHFLSRAPSARSEANASPPVEN